MTRVQEGRVLVTGGRGFVGGHLAEALVHAGARVTVLDNLHRQVDEPDGLRAASASGQVQFLHGDVRDLEAVRAAAQEARAIFHLAAQSRVVDAEADPDYAFSTNVGGTYAVLRAAQEAGARVIFASSREVYGQAARSPVDEDTPLLAHSVYGASKIAGEALCRAFAARGLGVAVLRLANLYGPRDRERVIPAFARSLLEGRPVRIYGQGKRLDFLWVGEAVKVMLCAAEGGPGWDSGPVNVGSGRGVLLEDLALEVARHVGGRARIERLEARSVETDAFVADVRRAQQACGWTPPEDPLERLGEVVLHEKQLLLPAVVGDML